MFGLYSQGVDWMQNGLTDGAESMQNGPTDEVDLMQNGSTDGADLKCCAHLKSRSTVLAQHQLNHMTRSWHCNSGIVRCVFI